MPRFIRFMESSLILILGVVAALAIVGGVIVVSVVFDPEGKAGAIPSIMQLAAPFVLTVVGLIALYQTSQKQSQIAKQASTVVTATAQQTGKITAQALAHLLEEARTDPNIVQEISQIFRPLMDDAVFRAFESKFIALDSRAAELSRQGQALAKRQTDLWNLANSVGRVARALCLANGVPIPPPLEKGSGMD